MIESKRKFKRFDLPLIVKFRPTYGPSQYSLGLSKNFSCQGLSIEARDFDFIKDENLELEIKFPQSNSSVSLLGDVIWKRQDGNTNVAGIKLKFRNKNLRSDLIEKISSYMNIPADSILHSKDIYHEMMEKPSKKFVPKPAKAKTRAAVERGKGIMKQYMKDESRCKVTFRLPREAAPDAHEVAIAGDFNNWNAGESPMSRLENGDFQATLTLSSGREYRFRYCIDGNRWENDWCADKYVPNSFGSDDSVVII